MSRKVGLPDGYSSSGGPDGSSPASGIHSGSSSGSFIGSCPGGALPADFFSAQTQALLVSLLAQRAASWQRQSGPPIYFYGCQSTLHWGAEARRRWEGKSLRRATGWRLREELSVDLERGLRLLTMPRTAEGHTPEGHKALEWQEALAGVLWRVGQVCRELARREGEAQAEAILRLAMESLWR